MVSGCDQGLGFSRGLGFGLGGWYLMLRVHKSRYRGGGEEDDGPHIGGSFAASDSRDPKIYTLIPDP